jgi:acyl carrier protein
MSDTFDKVKKVVVEQLGVESSKIELSSSFTSDLGADSLDAVELIMALEEEFNLEISDEDAEKMKTVGDIVSYLDERLK